MLNLPSPPPTGDELHELRNELNVRFDRLEEKLDAYTALAHRNEADITWVKGYIKISISMFVTIATSVVGYFLTGKV